MTKRKTATKLNTAQPTKPRNKPAPQTAAARMEVVPLSQLHNDPHNVNKHTERGHKLVEQSIRNRGIARPGFAARNAAGELVMLGGNLSSLEVPADIGFDEAVLVFTDGKRPVVHVRTDLDAGSDEARLLALEDNVSGVASYDPDIVELAELVDIKGFDEIVSDAEYRRLIGAALIAPDELWEGMPEFEQEDKLGFRAVIVHFENETDLADFERLIGQTITPKTKYIWHPHKEKVDRTNFKVEDES